MLSRTPKPTTVKVTPIVAPSEWASLHAMDDLAMPTQSPVWAEAIVHGSRYRDVSRHYAFADGARACLPLYAPRSVPRAAAVLRSPPAAWGFGGPVSSATLSVRHIAAILDDLASLRCAAIQVRPNPLTAAVWAEAADRPGWTAVPRNAHVLDLEGGFDKVWNERIPGKSRTKVRRAERAEVVIETGSDDRLVGEFHGLLETSFKRWARRQNETPWLASLRGMLRDPERKFLTMVRHAEPLVRISVARFEGAPVAAILVLMGREAHYTRGAMDEERIGQSYANYLLQTKAIEEACRIGCRHYHMGETGGSASLAQFKSGFGAVATPYAEYRHERIPVLSADRRIRSWVKSAIGFKDA